MSGQYFEREPESESRPVSCTFEYRGKTLRLTTDAGVFSRGEIDFGTKTLLLALPELRGRVLDLGCGFGAVGVSVGAVNPQIELVLSDVNLRALELARKNLKANGVCAQVVESDGFDALEGTFDTVLTNPPIRAGKQVIYRLFAQSAARLNAGGALYIVIRKQQGAQSAQKYLQTLFAAVQVVDKSAGFWVLKCEGGHIN